MSYAKKVAPGQPLAKSRFYAMNHCHRAMANSKAAKEARLAARLAVIRLDKTAIWTLLESMQDNREQVESKHALLDSIGNKRIEPVVIVSKPVIDKRQQSRRGLSCVYQTHFSRRAMAEAKAEIREQAMEELLPVLGTMIKQIAK